MLLTSDRRYHFAAGSTEVWERIGSVDEYQQWWPWLRRFEAAGLREGDGWRCEVRPPLPYVVRFTLELITVEEPVAITARLVGDIVGDARIDLADRQGAPGCEVRLRSRLAPANALLKVMAGVAAPLARFGHDWVLDTGARQFSARLGSA